MLQNRWTIENNLYSLNGNLMNIIIPRVPTLPSLPCSASYHAYPAEPLSAGKHASRSSGQPGGGRNASLKARTGQDGHAGGLEPASQALIVDSCSHSAGGRIKACLRHWRGRLRLCPCPCHATSPFLRGSCQGKRNLLSCSWGKKQPSRGTHSPPHTLSLAFQKPGPSLAWSLPTGRPHKVVRLLLAFWNLVCSCLRFLSSNTATGVCLGEAMESDSNWRM